MCSTPSLSVSDYSPFFFFTSEKFNNNLFRFTKDHVQKLSLRSESVLSLLHRSLLFLFFLAELPLIQTYMAQAIKHIQCCLVGESNIERALNVILGRLLTRKGFWQLQELFVITGQLRCEIKLKPGFAGGDLGVALPLVQTQGWISQTFT